MNLANLIQKNITTAIKNLYSIDVENVEVFHPENLIHGDYSTNVALTLSRNLKHSSVEIAKNLCYELQSLELSTKVDGEKINIFQKIETAEPGFINLVLSERWLKYLLGKGEETTKCYGVEFKNMKIMLEYTDPNPFKVFHIGHLMTNCIGESLARVYQYLGAEVKRANYQGDAGMHVAKSIWGLRKLLVEEFQTIQSLAQKPLKDRMDYLGRAYAKGATAYKEDKTAAEEMKTLNLMIFIAAQENLKRTGESEPGADYKKYVKNLDDKEYNDVKELYDSGRQWSLDYFETIYKRLGTSFDYYYFESFVGEYGYKLVTDHIEDGTFEKSDGALIFDGKKYGLHTRVFVNSLGLPVYEAKDLGLALIKYKDFPYDKSIIITANEINEYFKVVLKAMELIKPELSKRTEHLGHGMMKFKSGKMSSRTGDIIAGEEVLNELKDEIETRMEASSADVGREEVQSIADKLAVSSIKYLVLKYSMGSDIIYDRDQMLNVNGNTGPYMVYAYVRAQSVLEKSGFTTNMFGSYDPDSITLRDREKNLLREVYKLPEIALEAAKKYSPNLICNFVFELAQKFNAFYAEVPIINAEKEDERYFRLHLTYITSQVIKTALDLLGIDVVERM